MAKKNRIEKETRRLMESITDLVKRKNGAYKFKAKGKKAVKRIKRTCIHWIIGKKGAPTVTVVQDTDVPGNWKCQICGASFPIKPMTVEEAHKVTDALIGNVNQMQFFSVKMGGDSDDTKLLLRLKNDLRVFKKIQKNIINQVNKREQWESQKAKRNTQSQFDAFSGFNYRM